MSLPISEKNFLEKLASHVPGLSGYRDREARRETDRRLREFLASRLEEGRLALNTVRNVATEAGEFRTLDAVGRLDRALQKSVAALRFADHGYSGVFDQMKIGEAELDAIYAYDAGLLTDVLALSERLRAAAGTTAGTAPVSELATAAEGVGAKIGRRREILDKPENA